jgi:hypothetical protein
MDHETHDREVDANFDVFMDALDALLPEHLGEFALLKSREIVGFFESPGAAYRHALKAYGPLGFSIQEVTQEPIDLGFYSHVAGS